MLVINLSSFLSCPFPHTKLLCWLWCHSISSLPLLSFDLHCRGQRQTAFFMHQILPFCQQDLVDNFDLLCLFSIQNVDGLSYCLRFAVDKFMHGKKWRAIGSWGMSQPASDRCKPRSDQFSLPDNAVGLMPRDSSPWSRGKYSILEAPSGIFSACFGGRIFDKVKDWLVHGWWAKRVLCDRRPKIWSWRCRLILIRVFAFVQG